MQVKNVLLVDHEPALLEVARLAVAREEARDVQMTTARTGRDAIKLLDDGPFDLFISDLDMAEVDGLDLVEHVTRAHPGVSVAVSTAQSNDIAPRLARWPGLPCLQKPFEVDSFLDQIRTLLGRTPRGHIEGVTLSGLLHLLHAEARTCVLHVRSRASEGSMRVVDGELLDASFAQLRGIAAAMEMLAWPNARITLDHDFGTRERTVERSLIDLLDTAPPTRREGFDPEHLSSVRPMSRRFAVAEPPSSRSLLETFETPYERLAQLLESAAAGELIVADGSLEIHVHIQSGRIVWMTSPNARALFLRHLIETSGVKRDELREAIDDCKRTGEPILETIVQWELATLDTVRAALAAQVERGMSVLRTLPPSTRTVFLSRESHPERRISVSLDEIEAMNATPESPKSPTVRPPRPANSIPPAAPRANERVLEIAASLESAGVELMSLEIVQGKHQTVVRGAPSVASPDLARTLADTKAQLAAVRNEQRALIGVRLPEGDASVWCGVRDSDYGKAWGLLAQLAGSGPFAAAPSPLFVPFEAAAVASPSPWSPSPALARLLERWGDDCAIFATSNGGRETFSVGRAPGAVEGRPVSAADRAAKAHALARLLPQAGTASDGDVATDSVLIAYGSLWCLGAPIGEASGSHIWLALDRSLPQGIAWMLLGDLRREGAEMVAQLSPTR